MDLKTLTKLEYDNCKTRMKEETEGLYVLIYIGLVFVVFISMLYGVSYDADDNWMMLELAVLVAFLYQSATVYLSYVKEDGRRVNIFEKYVYIPVEPAMLRRAKLIAAARIIALPVLCGQLAAILIRVADPDQQCAGLFDVSVYIPLMTGILFLLEKSIEYRGLSRVCSLKK